MARDDHRRAKGHGSAAVVRCLSTGRGREERTWHGTQYDVRRCGNAGCQKRVKTGGQVVSLRCEACARKQDRRHSLDELLETQRPWHASYPAPKQAEAMPTGKAGVRSPGQNSAPNRLLIWKAAPWISALPTQALLIWPFCLLIATRHHPCPFPCWMAWRPVATIWEHSCSDLLLTADLPARPKSAANKTTKCVSSQISKRVYVSKFARPGYNLCRVTSGTRPGYSVH